MACYYCNSDAMAESSLITYLKKGYSSTACEFHLPEIPTAYQKDCLIVAKLYACTKDAWQNSKKNFISHGTQVYTTKN